MLREFFDNVGPWLRGERPPSAFRALGATPSTDSDLDFYPGLTQYGYRNSMRTMFGPVAALIDAWGGPPWDGVVDAFVRAHPPGGFVWQDMARPFAGFVEDHFATATFLDHVAPGTSTAAVLGAVADYAHCKVLARYAVDGDGLFLDERVFVRRYSVDVSALTVDPRAVGAGVMVTICLYRDLTTDLVNTFSPTLATMAAFAALLGHPRTGALAIPDAALAKELARLVSIGLVDPRTAATASPPG